MRAYRARCLALVVPVVAGAQALPNINSLRVGYNTRKTAAKPEGELKTQLDAVDKAIADASKAGNLGEVRRQMAKGLTLLAGNAWTPAADYQNSLTLRSERTVIDSSVPYAVRLEQIYAPTIESDAGADRELSLQAHTAGAARSAAPPPVPPACASSARSTRWRATCANRPTRWRLNVAGVEDGRFIIERSV